MRIPFKWTHADEASKWCLANLKDDDWTMDLEQMGPVKYVFTFKSKTAATLFALRWAQYA